MGRPHIKFLHDKVSCYQSVIKDGTLCGFDEIEIAAGKAPGMSHLDAAVCPVMERRVEEAGAKTPDEIRAAVKAAWKEVTPDMCLAISARVRQNMLEVIRRKGGNFYKG